MLLKRVSRRRSINRVSIVLLAGMIVLLPGTRSSRAEAMTPGQIWPPAGLPRSASARCPPSPASSAS